MEVLRCPQIALPPTRTCVSGTLTKVWFAASLATAWCWPIPSAAATTVEAGALNATHAHTGIQVSKRGGLFYKTSNLGYFVILAWNTLFSSPPCSEMFSRLCDMHLETESDGEPDFPSFLTNYKPGQQRLFFLQCRGVKLKHTVGPKLENWTKSGAEKIFLNLNMEWTKLRTVQ